MNDCDSMYEDVEQEKHSSCNYEKLIVEDIRKQEVYQKPHVKDSNALKLQQILREQKHSKRIFTTGALLLVMLTIVLFLAVLLLTSSGKKQTDYHKLKKQIKDLNATMTDYYKLKKQIKALNTTMHQLSYHPERTREYNDCFQELRMGSTWRHSTLEDHQVIECNTTTVDMQEKVSKIKMMF